MNSVDPELADCLLLIPDFVDVLELQLGLHSICES